jgi:hypothetical protein
VRLDGCLRIINLKKGGKSVRKHEEIISAIMGRKKSLGHGYFSLVFRCVSDDYVAKWSFFDEGYHSFIRYADTMGQMASPNIHLPKVKLILASKCILYTKIERLWPLSDPEAQKIDKIFSQMKHQWFQELHLHRPRELQGIFRAGGFGVPLLFAETILDIAKLSMALDGYPDLHSKNIMRRANGVLVINDPLTA